MFSKVEISGVDTSKLEVLKSDETTELLRRAHTGDREARDRLVKSNLKLVLSAVQRFSNRVTNGDDIFQVGCIGLLKAIDNFNLDMNVKFSTYAFPLIFGEIRRYLRDYALIRVSRSTRDLAYRAMQAKEKLQVNSGREPSVEEIAQELNASKEDVVLALEAIVEPSSLYEAVYSDGRDNIYLMDQIRDTDTDSDWLDELLLRQAISRLSEREKKILSLRFFAGKTQIEVSRVIGISQAQVSRIEKAALERIKQQL